MRLLTAPTIPEIPTEEPVTLASLVRIILIVILSGLMTFEVWTPTDPQLAWLISVFGVLEGILLVFTRSKTVAERRFGDEVDAEKIIAEEVGRPLPQVTEVSLDALSLDPAEEPDEPVGEDEV